MFNQNRKVPCSFKEKCRNFVNKQNCKFSHDPCPHLKHCKFKQKCQWYHPQLDPNNPKKQEEINKISLSKRLPVNQTPCKFGMKCNKRLTGQCHFLHVQSYQNQPNQRPNVSNLPCKFGSTCFKFANGKCPYLHQRTSQNQISVEKNDIVSQNIFSHQSNLQRNQVFTNRNQNNPQYENQMCMKFAFNQCSNDQSECPLKKKHSFTFNNSIKRLYYNGKKPLNSLTSCAYLNIDRATFYAIHLNQKIVFMKFNQVAKSLQPISDKILKQKSTITHLLTQNSLIIYGCKSINFDIIFYKPKTGNIQRISNAHFNQILGLAYIEGNNILISIAKGQKAKVYLDEQQTQEGSLKFNSVLNISNNYNFLNFIKKIKFLQQQMIIGGTQSGRICFWNNKLDSSMLQLSSAKQIQDVQCAVCNGHPYCFISVIDQQNQKSQVLMIDTLSFQVSTVLESKVNYRAEHFKKMLIIGQFLLVQIGTGNVLIYHLPNFNIRVGLIPLNNPIVSMQKDKQMNKFFIVEGQGHTQGSFSIFKLNI